MKKVILMFILSASMSTFADPGSYGPGEVGSVESTNLNYDCSVKIEEMEQIYMKKLTSPKKQFKFKEKDVDIVATLYNQCFELEKLMKAIDSSN